MFLVLVAMSSTITQAITQDGMPDDNACMVNTLIASGVDREKATQYARRMASFDFAYNDLNAANDLSLRLLGIAENHRAKILACTGNSRSCAQPVLNVCTGHGDCTLNGDGGTASYICSCEIGYSGNLCHVDVCVVYTGSGARLASRPRCQNGASCIRSTGTCNCLSGFTGEECETLIDNCASKPCYHGGRCENSVNNFSCHCQVGYAGYVCKVQWLTRDSMKQKMGKMAGRLASTIEDNSGTLASAISSLSTLVERVMSSVTDVATLLKWSVGKYKYFHEAMTWHGALKHCQLVGGSLAIIRHEGHWQAISDLMEGKSGFPWLGATDFTREGIWRWTDDSVLIYQKWYTYTHEPNGGRSENCLQLAPSHTTWNDNDCSTKLPFICQFNLL